jgi:cytochrome c-type biogenesis protein CcmH/NrfF
MNDLATALIWAGPAFIIFAVLVVGGIVLAIILWKRSKKE